MANAAKIAISIDPKLLRVVERLRERTGESRSALVSRALRSLTESAEHVQHVAEYVDAYRAMPETEADVVEARRLARRSLAAVPWDEE